LWRGVRPVPQWIQLLLAGIVSIGVIAVGKAIITGLAISRRPSHHLAEQPGTSPASKQAEIPPPGYALDLMGACFAPHDQPHLRIRRIAERHRRAGW